MARLEINWCLESIISWPYKQWYQVRPFELSWPTAGCAQYLPLSGTPLRACKLSSLPSLENCCQPTTGPGLSSGAPSLLEPQCSPVEKCGGIWSEYFTELEGNFQQVPLYMRIVSVWLWIDSNHNILLLWLQWIRFYHFVNAKLAND